MVKIEIPGENTVEARHLVLDFNGTLAIDGKLIEGIRPLLGQLSKELSVHVLTADTFGTSKAELDGIDCTLNVIQSLGQDKQKEAFVSNLGPEGVIAIGNGRNDARMLQTAALGIAVIQKEGASVQSLMNAKVVCPNILDALELILHPRRISATLRN